MDKVINSFFIIVFAIIGVSISCLYIKPNQNEIITAELLDKQTKAEDLYYNELAVNHPLVIMDKNSPLIQLKKKTNKIVLK